MKITATITKLNPVVERVTERGNVFRSQSIVLAWKENSEDGRILDQSVEVTLMYENLGKFEAMQRKEGDEITVELTMQMLYGTRSGRSYNNIGAYVIN